MIGDIIIIILIALFTVIGVKRGVAKTVLGILCFVISVFLSNYFADYLSKLIYDSCIKEIIVNNVNNFIALNGVDKALNNWIEALPNWLGGVVEFMGAIFAIDASATNFNINSSSKISATTAVNTIETAIAPLVIAFFRLILLILLFIIILSLARKLSRLVLKVFNIPIIKQLNQILGGIAGFAEGIILVIVIVNLFLPIINVANPSLIDNGVIGEFFKFFIF